MIDTSVIIKPNERKEAYKEAKRVSRKFYDFLAEDRTYMPFLMSIFKNIRLPLQVTAYFALFLSFIVDRFRNLIISRGDSI